MATANAFEPDRLKARRTANAEPDIKFDAPRESAYEMISVPAALECVLSHTESGIEAAGKGNGNHTSVVPLMEALDRILAHDVVAVEPFPPFRASIMVH
jgi:hypothetical protein